MNSFSCLGDQHDQTFRVPAVSHLSKAPLLLSTKSVEEESSFPTFTFVIPVQHNNYCHSWHGLDLLSQLKREREEMFTQDAFLWRWRHNESIWSMLFIKFLIEAQEVAEASPHC